MSTRPDLLADSDLRPDRLHYATGALLDREDFLAEQLYHRGRLARALLHLHGHGTVTGLRVEVEDSGGDETVRVHEGLAIDRLGRLVEVPRSACLRLGRWMDHWEQTDPGELTKARVLPDAKPDQDPIRTQAPGEDDAGPSPGRRRAEAAEGEAAAKDAPAEQPKGDEPEWKAWKQGYLVADVFLSFASCERGKTPAFATGPFDALDAIAPSRVRDGYELSLVPRESFGVPGDEWAGLSAAGVEARGRLAQRTLLHQKLQPGREGARVQRPRHYPEEADPSSVFLARLFVPIMPQAKLPGGDKSPTGFTRDRSLRVLVNNYLRPFAYSGPALAWLARQ